MRSRSDSSSASQHRFVSDKEAYKTSSIRFSYGVTGVDTKEVEMSERDETRRVERRKFLKNAGLAGLGAAGSGFMGMRVAGSGDGRRE